MDRQARQLAATAQNYAKSHCGCIRWSITEKIVELSLLGTIEKRIEFL
jgi:hypothetical protein